MTRIATIAIVLAAVVALVGSLVIRVPVARVMAGNDQVVCARVDEDTPIVVTFTHSMYGGEVRETYRPGPGDSLTRTRIVTEVEAAAEYYAFYGQVTRAEDGFEVVAPVAEFDSLPITVDQVGDLRLQIGDKAYPLATMLGETTSVVLSVERRRFLLQVFDTHC